MPKSFSSLGIIYQFDRIYIYIYTYTPIYDDLYGYDLYTIDVFIIDN